MTASSGRLPLVSSKEIIRVLKRCGFDYAPKRGKGSHIALIKSDKEKESRLVIIPKKKVIPRGTLSILDQAGLSKTDFIYLL
ncbi:addiction module toxin, HicA family [candidate division KSB1 bacterium]|nr:addiction module toxin, HicA family [candidate division KSB1 bacterium]